MGFVFFGRVKIPSPVDLTFIQREEYTELHQDKGLAHVEKKVRKRAHRGRLQLFCVVTHAGLYRFFLKKDNNCILEHMAMHYYY